MGCLFAILVLAFPRIAIVLLYLFSSFFDHLYKGLLLPVVGFLFLPLTFLAYSYMLSTRMVIGLTQLVVLFIAVIIDLGLVGRHAWSRRGNA